MIECGSSSEPLCPHLAGMVPCLDRVQRLLPRLNILLRPEVSIVLECDILINLREVGKRLIVCGLSLSLWPK